MRECPGGRPGCGVKAREHHTVIRGGKDAGYAKRSARTIGRPGFSRKVRAERIRWDPKDRELWVTRTKPEETLVEVRSGTDVQIVHQSCL